ncbi:cyclin-G-associated kinase [Neodiprion pinetum]|uniref:cyclin-G-associated kinase n=1 Tax=Neodiprion pinetum TaxID=441929 RepID=UPI001EDCA2E6|nr:cyclin-G-associated kinase [Neodiprion pinetum]
MSDYFRSALGYLNGGTNSDEYVGQTIEINNVKLRVTRLLAEGGWAMVYAVEDVATGKEYALKKLIAVDDEANRIIIQEIDTLKKLSGHQNIIQYLCAQRVQREDQKSCEYLLVTELCNGGTTADLLRNVPANTLTLPQICRIAYQATRAIHHMHAQPEPIIHRDIKLENFLIGANGLIKLCDFGSVTTQQILPDVSWSAQRRSMLEEQMAKFTTPMYRAPEIMDTWNNEPIGPPVDCWALGCVLYALVTLRHPFPDSNKLAIVNARYPPLPPNPRLACFHDLIKGCLQSSPVQRMTTATLLERLAAIAESNSFDPRESANIEPLTAAKPSPPPRPMPLPVVPPPRPSPPPAVPPSRPPPAQPLPSRSAAAPPSGLFSSLRGGAGSILRNLKDTSNKVMQTVQQSMARTELDASYLTSRILIMPYPADGIESAYRSNHVEDVRAFLQARHPPPAKIQLYNLSRGRPNSARLPGKHIDCSFVFAAPESNTPLLSALYQLCQDIYRYLDADFNHVVVIYCTDGYRASATVACALLLYSGALATCEEAIALFTTRRCQAPLMQPSELRSLYYMKSLAQGICPHTKPISLRSLLLQPVPLFTRARDGCRPYVEIYSGGTLVFSTRRPDYEDMKLFGVMEGKVVLVLGDAMVKGDVTVAVFHARQQLGRIMGIKIASIQFHTGYISSEESVMIFEKPDLDDVPDLGGRFKVTLNISVIDGPVKSIAAPAPWDEDSSSKPIPDPLFGSTLEMEETLENFRTNVPAAEISQQIPAAQLSVENPNESECYEALPQEEVQTEEPKFFEADLLNLGMPDTSVPAPPAPASAPTIVNPDLNIFSSDGKGTGDLLGGFADFSQAEIINTEALTNSSTGSNLLFEQNQQGKSSTSDLLFDPLQGSGNADLLGGWVGSGATSPSIEENFPRNASTPNFAAQTKDPFANLAGSLGAGLNSSWSGTPRDSSTPQSASPAAGSTPVHSSPRIQKPPPPSDSGGNDTGVFSTKPAKAAGDAFGDLLGSQGYNFFSTRRSEKESPKTINEMRKVEAAKTMDPDRLKIAEWTEGKKGNLRALLCSLHTVLWPEAERWQRCEMHQLVTAADVKKSYRRACLAVHPDKQAGTANENIAKLIFMELNNAWSTFENDAAQQNLFS